MRRAVVVLLCLAFTFPIRFIQFYADPDANAAPNAVIMPCLSFSRCATKTP